MRSAAFVVGFMVSGLLGYSQSVIVSGQLKNAETGVGVPFAAVQITNSSSVSITDNDGKFDIEVEGSGKYVLQTSCLGYQNLERELNIEAGKPLWIELEVQPTIMSLPEFAIVSTSLTAGGTNMEKIPGSVHYISSKELNKYSYTDINRTLRAVPGLNIQEEDGYGLRPNIGLRGTGVERSSKITIMEDGVLMAPAPYSAPAAYYFPTIGRMQGVEILKGSSQIQYGPYTTGGALNLISTQIPGRAGASAMLMGGSNAARNAHVHAGNTHKNVGYVFETFQYKADGFKDLDGGGNTGFDKKDYLAKFRLNTNPTAKVYQALTFKIGQATESSYETYLGLTNEDFASTPFRRYAASQVDKMQTSQTQYSLMHTIRFSKGFDVTTTAYKSEFARNWYKLDKVKANSTSSRTKIGSILENPQDNLAAYNVLTGATSNNDDALFVKANNRSYQSQGLQTVMGFHFQTSEIEHDVNIGVRYHTDEIDRFQWVDEYAMNDGVMMLTAKGIPGTESNRIEDAKALATYAQYKMGYKRLLVVPGIRFENMTMSRMDFGKNDPDRLGTSLSGRSNQVNVFIPGIGISYQVLEELTGFAGMHKGFSPPGNSEGALPESSTNYEAGVRLNNANLAGEAIFFLSDYSNLLGADLAAAGGAGTTELYNGGEAIVKGIEFQARYDLLSGENARMSMPFTITYTYTDAEFESSFDSDFDGWGKVNQGDKLPYIAAHQIALNYGLQHKKFSLNVGGKYVSEMRTEAGQGAIVEAESTDRYLVFDLSATYYINKVFSFFSTINNLTNQNYIVARRPAGLRPGMPRVFNIGLRAQF